MPASSRDLLKRALLTVALVVIALPVADAAVGVVAHWWPEAPRLYPQSVDTVGIETFWRMTDQGQKPIVFTGSSMSGYAFSPLEFDERVAQLTGARPLSVNASVFGEGVMAARDLITHLYLPRSVPLIIYGIETRALNSPSDNEQIAQTPLGYALKLPPGIVQNMALWLTRHSNIIRYRLNFRDVLSGTRDMGFDGGPMIALPENLGQATAPLIYFDSSLPSQLIDDYSLPSIAPDSEAALDDIVNGCLAGKTRCIFVSMPVTNELQAALTAPDKELYQRTLADKVIARGITVWDFNTAACRAYFGDRSFRDEVHLNSVGVPLFNDMIASLYVRSVLGDPVGDKAAIACVKVS